MPPDNFECVRVRTGTMPLISSMIFFYFSLHKKVEAEHNEQFSEKEKAVKEKDVVISTLGTKLTESQGSITSLQASISQQLQEVEKAQNEAAAAKGDAQALKEELEKIRKHQDEAIIAAREETIKEATAQFDQYNEMYRAMRNKCNAAESKVRLVLK